MYPAEDGQFSLIIKLLSENKEGFTMSELEAMLRKECGHTIVKEELEKKLRGKPDFILEDHYCRGKGAYCEDKNACVQLVAKAKLPTRYGEFTIYGFYDNRDAKEHTVIIQGDIEGKENVPLRVHSECHTGDVMGSIKCDCRDQLEFALDYISKQPYGAVVYMKQEGRGIGLLNKIKAYQLQDLGLDTIEANQYLGFCPDSRDYSIAAKIINLLKVKSIQLITNNPDKIAQLSKEGIPITGRIPVVIEPTKFSENYLNVKKERMGHIY